LGYLALALGLAFELLGFAGLFSAAAVILVLVLLIAQELWIVAAAITLVVRTGKAPDTAARQADNWQDRSPPIPEA